MISKQDLVKKVKYHFGLNIYETKVWLALISKNIATVGEIAEMSGVPRSRVYDVLESLEKQGFAISKLGKPVKYIAVKPSVVIEHIKNNVLRDAEDRVKGLSTIRESPEYSELEMLHVKGIKLIQPEELSSAVRGRQNIHSQMKEMISNAGKEVTIVSTADALKRKAYFLRPLFEKLKAQNVSIKVAVATSTNPGQERDELKLATLSKELGVQVRKIKINARFCVIDNTRILIFLTPDADEERDVAVWMDSPLFSKALTTFLNPIWHS